MCKEIKDMYKKNGGFEKALSDVKNILGIEEKSFKNWAGLCKLILKKQLFNKDKKDLFTSKEAKIIYTLLNHDGEQRAEILEITSEMYSSLEKSKRWYRELVKLLHPDNCHHYLATEATAELNKIYEKMKLYGK